METSSTHTDTVEQIRSFLKDMLKIIKVVSMYPEDNPLPQSMKRIFAENLEHTLSLTGDVELYVEKERFALGDETVFVDRSREERLAGLFFDAGVTTITFRSGLDVNEIYRLLDIIKSYINSPKHGFDLVNGIWESGITHFAVTTVEDIALASYDDDFRVQEIVDGDTGRRRRSPSADDLPEGYESIFIHEDSVDDEGDSGFTRDLDDDSQCERVGIQACVYCGDGRRSFPFRKDTP